MLAKKSLSVYQGNRQRQEEKSAEANTRSLGKGDCSGCEI